MKLHDIFYNIAFICGLMGIAGLGGAIDMDGSLIAPAVLILICALSGYIGMKEEGRCQ